MTPERWRQIDELYHAACAQIGSRINCLAQRLKLTPIGSASPVPGPNWSEPIRTATETKRLRRKARTKLVRASSAPAQKR
jgi:hypothetical protein